MEFWLETSGLVSRSKRPLKIIAKATLKVAFFYAKKGRCKPPLPKSKVIGNKSNNKIKTDDENKTKEKRLIKT